MAIGKFPVQARGVRGSIKTRPRGEVRQSSRCERKHKAPSVSWGSAGRHRPSSRMRATVRSICKHLRQQSRLTRLLSCGSLRELGRNVHRRLTTGCRSHTRACPTYDVQTPASRPGLYAVARIRELLFCRPHSLAYGRRISPRSPRPSIPWPACTGCACSSRT